MSSTYLGTMGLVSGILGVVVPPMSPPTTSSNTVAPGNIATVSAGVYANVAATVLSVLYASDGTTPIQCVVQLNKPGNPLITIWGPSINLLVSM